MTQIGSWIKENCVSVGYDALILNGAVEGFASFQQAVEAGDVWYSVLDLITGSREEGIGTFDGINTILRKEVHLIMEGELYEKDPVYPLDLSGSSVVTCTMNARAFDALMAGVNTPVIVAPNEPLFRKYDDTSEANTYYKGWSGTTNDGSASAWKILKGIESPEGFFTEQWADGNENEDNIWDNRTSLSYA